MNSYIPPAFVFILAAFIIPLLKGRFKSIFIIAVPVIGFFYLLQIPEGLYGRFDFLSFQVVLLKVDRLSLVFGYIFHIVSFVTVIYILNFKNDLEYFAGFFYAGAALGVIFAGDFFTFFVFWELLTIGSILLIWARKTKKSLSAGFRYLLFHSVGGLILFAGIVMYVRETGSLTFGYIGIKGLSTYLIFLGMGINCAWPFLHTWLTDAYPEATIGGTVFLSAFTTKTAVYALARAYPGVEYLIWIGTAMAAFPIFFAVIENDLRKVLAYSLVNQVGFMVVGIGIGSQLAINGAIAHAFNDILFKGLLFMSMGAVMYRTGKINATDLGGLYKSMPWTTFFCIVGAASISAFPLFSGFVSKSMVMSAAGQEHMIVVWLVLLFASAGVFHHAGIKIPFFAFFSHDAGHRVKEAPLNMLIAMGITAFLCIFNGTFHGTLYSILPYKVTYEPYTVSHILTQTELLFFSALAFTLLMLAGIYPAEIRAVNLDIDWVYRKMSAGFVWVMDKTLNEINRVCDLLFAQKLTSVLINFSKNAAGLTLFCLISPISGKSGEEKRALKQQLLVSFRIGAIPVGISAATGALFLFVLFFLR